MAVTGVTIITITRTLCARVTVTIERRRKLHNIKEERHYGVVTAAVLAAALHCRDALEPPAAETTAAGDDMPQTTTAAVTSSARRTDSSCTGRGDNGSCRRVTEAGGGRMPGTSR